jgi:hypothetical protein
MAYVTCEADATEPQLVDDAGEVLPAATVAGTGDRTPQVLTFETVMIVVVLTFWKVMVTGAATAGAAMARLAITERTAMVFITLTPLNGYVYGLASHDHSSILR